MGQFDDAAMKAGKELSDVIQEAVDSDNRFNDVFIELIEAGGEIKNFVGVMKENNLDKKKAIMQMFRGAMNDMVGEDFSLDVPSEPGSQG